MTAMQRTPLFEEHVALGARMVEFAGWEMPISYAGIVEEHRAVRSSAGIFDVSHMGEFRVFGQGALDALQRLVTNDLDRIQPVGEALYTVMCDESGGIIDDLLVYHTGDLEYLIVANAATADADREWIAAGLPDGVQFLDESQRTALIAVQGPAALEVVGELASEEFVPPARFTIGEAVMDTVPVLVSRTGYTGEDGVELFCHADHAFALWRALLSFPSVTPCGLGARDTLRLEMGYRLYGTDMDRTTDPISAGLGWVVPKEKTGYIGSKAIARIREEKPTRRLVGLRVVKGIPRHGYPVLHDGVEVGKVASGTFSPTLGAGIATAYLPVAAATEGTQVSVDIRGKLAEAVVTKMPFVHSTSLDRDSV